MQKSLAKSGIEDVIPLRNCVSVMSFFDELTLMRLRLGFLNEDKAERFGVSPTRCSCIFTTWIKTLSKVWGKALVVWPPKESIRRHLLKIFLKSGYGKYCVIIDCAEVFIERPKSLSAQAAATWSDYKHHNTLKFLVGITPIGFILFISSCYGVEQVTNLSKEILDFMI